MLEEYLKKPSNSVIREKLFKHKFLYDVQLEFLKQKTSLLYYESDYDRDGFDLLFDNLKSQKHFQMKSIMQSSSTNTFSIHRTLLRPRIDELNYYPLSHDSFGVGYGGGVILIVAEEENNNLNFSYQYCDGLILCSFYAKLFEYKSPQKQNSVIKAFKEYQNPNKIGGRVKLTRSCFLKFNSIMDLFIYAGLGKYDNSERWNLQQAMARQYAFHDKAYSKYTHSDCVKITYNKFQNLISWRDLKC